MHVRASRQDRAEPSFEHPFRHQQAHEVLAAPTHHRQAEPAGSLRGVVSSISNGCPSSSMESQDKLELVGCADLPGVQLGQGQGWLAAPTNEDAVLRTNDPSNQAMEKLVEIVVPAHKNSGVDQGTQNTALPKAKLHEGQPRARAV